ncbi:MAG: hypothetical protein AAFX92_02140 [Pseudomonadota bacterium]
MNVLEKMKTDQRVAEIQKQIDDGESRARPAAQVASGVLKKVPAEPVED